MTPTAEEVLHAALGLSEVDRFELIEALLATQAPDPLPANDDLNDVTRRRSAEMDSGHVAGIPWAEVKRRTREAIGG